VDQIDGKLTLSFALELMTAIRFAGWDLLKMVSGSQERES